MLFHNEPFVSFGEVDLYGHTVLALVRGYLCVFTLATALKAPGGKELSTGDKPTTWGLQQLFDDRPGS
jgi:hypothetical protein